MARKKKPEEHVNHERWLVSYADFITLLFAFFTALYAMSSVDAKKANKLVFSTRAAFNVDFFPSDAPGGGASTIDPASTAGSEVKIMPDRAKVARPKVTQAGGLRHMQTVLDEIRELIRTNKIEGVQARVARNNVVVSLKDAAFFEPGSTRIRRSSLPKLDAIAEKLLATHLDLRIEGHTDDRAPNPHARHNNWEVSTERAISVVRYFLEQFAFAPESLSVAGYASYRPIAAGDTEEARSSNRRVDIVLLTPAPRLGAGADGAPSEHHDGADAENHDGSEHHDGSDGEHHDGQAHHEGAEHRDGGAAETPATTPAKP